MIEIFGREEFSKALGFFPLGFKVRAEGHQFVFRVPIAQKLTCACGQAFYPVPGYDHAQCPKCGVVGKLNGSLVPGEVVIDIYSSIDPISGKSRDVAKDSIRLALRAGDGKYLAKLGHYITRQPGWENRLKNKCRELWKIAIKLPRCTKGHKASLCKCRSGPHTGQRFWKCWRCNEWLGWEESND